MEGSRSSRLAWRTIASLLLVALTLVEAAIVERQRRGFVIPDWIEIVDEPVADDLRTVQRAVRVRETKVTYDGAQLWRVHASEGQATLVSNVVSEFQEAGLFSMWSGNDTAVDVMVRPDAIPRVARYLQDKDVKYDVVIADLQKAIDEENPPLSEEAMEELEGRKGHRMEWTSYHRLDDIHGYLNYLADSFPNICSVMNIGNSVEGKPLKVLRISNGKPNAPALWIDGGIHAREWISPAVVTYVIDQLVENSENLEADYYILPVVNPDGYEYTFMRDRLWRKNRRRSPGSSCTGVDLNRNFGYRWGGKGTSKNPCHEIFSGSAPFSEPETDAIRNFFEASAANFKAYLTFHSYGQYILYPWGYDRRVPPDYADLARVGRQAATAMKMAGGAASVYTVGNSATTLYAAAGGSDDWAKAMMKIKYTYTIELRDTGKNGFVLPARYIIPTAKEALAAVEVVTEACKLL
ncbi:hypothetical protein KM043_008431 [Ampulex compressa]|nr:hypothetical protein KM043_008431 [Ampulex compressa]